MAMRVCALCMRVLCAVSVVCVLCAVSVVCVLTMYLTAEWLGSLGKDFFWSLSVAFDSERLVELVELVGEVY